MAAPLQWLFAIYDKISGPADKISKSMRGMIGPTQGFEKELGKLQDKINNIKMNPEQFRALQAAKKEMRGLGDSGGGMNWASFRHGLFETIGIARGVYDVLRSAGEAAVDFGKRVIESAGYIERIDLALTAITGSAAMARDQMERFQVVANKAGPTTTREMTAMGADLLTRGFKSAELPQAVGAALDVSALNPNNAGAGGEFISILTNMKEMGQFSERAMRTLRTLGIEIPDVKAALAQQFGVKVDAVKKLIEQGKVDAASGLNAIYTAISKKSGGPLGALGEKAAVTVEGLLHKLKSVPETLFEGLARSAGYEKFRKFLEQLAGDLSPGSPFFEQMQAGVTSAFDTFMDVFGLKGPDAVKVIEARIASMIGTAKQLAPAARDFVVMLVDAASAAMKLAKYVSGIVNDWRNFKKDWENLQDLMGGKAKFAIANNKINENSPEWKKRGQQMVDGLAGGMSGAVPQLYSAADKIASVPSDVVEQVNQIHSPSRLFHKLGRYTAEGYAQGIESGADVIDLAMQRAIRAPSSGAVAGGGGRGPTITIAEGAFQIIIEGAGKDAKEIAEEVERAFRRMMPEALASAGEQLALEVGG